MSQRGMKLFAAALAQLQTLEHELCAIGSAAAKTEDGKQDLILARLAAKARDAVGQDFVRLTLAKPLMDEATPKKKRKASLERK